MQEQEDLVSNLVYYHPHPNHDRIKHIAKIHRERSLSSFNRKVAVFLTKNIGSMWTAYLFVLLAFVGLASILGYLAPIVVILVTWLSQTFIQLVLLPVIMVGQNVLNEHNEAQAEVTYENTKHSLDDEKLLIEHLNAQDTVLTQQNEMLIELQRKILEIQQQQENYLQFISHEINAMKQQPKTARRRVSAEGNK
jgi:signal transduction histidine kinase